MALAWEQIVLSVFKENIFISNDFLGLDSNHSYYMKIFICKIHCL